MSMTRAGATLLLMQIVMVCPMLLTPVTFMSGAEKGESQMRAQFQANKERVLKILEEREWYRTFYEMLKKELTLKGDDPNLLRAVRAPVHLLDLPRIRRSAPEEMDTHDRPIWRPARSVPTQENSKVEVSAALKVDGKVCLNVTKRAEAIRMGDSNEIIKADIGNTEILLSMKVTKKEADAPPEAADVAPPPESESPRPPASPPAQPKTPLGGGGVGDVSASIEGPPRLGGTPTVQRPPTAGGFNDSGKPSFQGSYSEVLTECADKNYCLFGGKCQYYAIINMQLCSCRKGYKGNRCELYDLQEVLNTLDTAHKRHVIGNGPIKQEDHVDVLSVVESTAIYLLHVPNSFPSEQALQLMESILRH